MLVQVQSNGDACAAAPGDIVTVTNFPVSNATSAAEGGDRSALTAGAIAGISVACAAVAAVLIAAVFIVLRRRQNAKVEENFKATQKKEMQSDLQHQYVGKLLQFAVVVVRGSRFWVGRAHATHQGRPPTWTA